MQHYYTRMFVIIICTLTVILELRCRRFRRKIRQYSPNWLITGKGEKTTGILQEPQEDFPNNESVKLTNDIIQALKKVISSQETTIRSQEITIAALQKRITDLENKK